MAYSKLSTLKWLQKQTSMQAKLESSKELRINPISIIRKASEFAEWQQGFDKPFSPERWYFFNWSHHRPDTIYPKPQFKRKKNNLFQRKTATIRDGEGMFVSWPVPRGKGSDAAPQGDGIWDHLPAEKLPLPPRGGPGSSINAGRLSSVTFAYGLCKHEK